MAGKKQPAPTKPSKGGAGKPTNSSSSKAARPAQTTTQNGGSEGELRHQQTLLDIFSYTFRDVLEADDFASQLQELKGALFNRDFEGAFAREAALDVYAARWSPTRALCYARVLRGLDAHLRGLVGDTYPLARTNDRSHDGLGNEIGAPERGEDKQQDESAVKNNIENTGREEAILADQRDSTIEEGKTQSLRILAIGGAAAEIAAFADYIASHTSTSTTTLIQGEITLLDIGPWGSVISRLQTALATAPPISRYASAVSKASNTALVPSSQFRSTFIQKDILSMPGGELAALISQIKDKSNANINKNNNTPVLITLLFTLNELYTAGGIKQTTTFLRSLSSPSTDLAPGSLLLVVDSPGSYSEAAVGGKDVKKRYPMQWLLEHTLISPSTSRRKKPRQAEKSPEEGGEQQKQDKEGEEMGEEMGEREGQGESKAGISWEKIESHDSVWFRVAENLRYPIALENMRYQMHLYRACVR